MPTRKTTHDTDANVLVNTPPGPTQFEVRADGKIRFLQRVYHYTIDQTNPEQTIITAHLTPPNNEKPTAPREFDDGNE